MIRLVRLIFVCSIFAGVLAEKDVVAWDWPQILGPSRNGVAVGEQLLEKWPAKGPRKIWSYKVGEGYAGPAVVDGKVIIFHRLKNQQLAESLDAKTGESIWKRELPAVYQSGGIDSDRGSKCVPLIQKGKVYLLDPAGQLFCLNLSDGQQVWTRDIAEDFSAPSGFFGFGSTPIVVDKKLLLNVGGKDSAIVAFDLDNGKTIWKSVDDRASYSSPIAIKLGDQAIGVFVTRSKLLGLNPANGKVLFQMPFGKRGATVNGASPVFADNHLFVSAAYNVGARWIELEDKGAEVNAKVKWSNDKSFSSQYSTPVYYKGHLYGTAGREDFGDGTLRCVNATTGEVKWTQKMPVGHTILAGDKLLVLDCLGSLHLIDATAERFNQLASTRVFPGKSRAMPALVDGLLYIRSNGPDGELVCFEVGK